MTARNLANRSLHDHVITVTRHAINLYALQPISDVLDYLLERSDPAVQHVEEFLQIYEDPYKVTPPSGKFLKPKVYSLIACENPHQIC